MRLKLIAVVCTALVIGACEGCEDEEPGEPAGDAGDVVDTQADGVDEDVTDDVVADGDDDVADTEGDVTDTGDDADAAPTTATVKVMHGSEPVPDIRVVFHNPDGDVTTDTTTDEAGEASAEVVEGSMVTAIDAPPNTFTRYVTLTDLSPGTETLLQFAPDSNPQKTVEVTPPGSFTDATTYPVTIGCNFGTSIDGSDTVTLGVREPCRADSVDVLAVARDSEDLLAYATQKGVSLDQATTSVSLNSWRDDFVAANTEFTDLPGDGSFDLELRGFFGADYRVWPLFLDSQTVSAGTATFDGNVPPGFQPELLLTWELQFFETGQQDSVLTGGTIRKSDTSTDVSASVSGSNFLPLVTSASVSDPASARPDFDWQTEPVVSGGATIDEADAFYTRLRWVPRGEALRPGQGGADGTPPGVDPSLVKVWVVLGPSDRTTVTFPSLPGDIDTPNGEGVTPTVGFIDAGAAEGYDEYLQEPEYTDLYGFSARYFFDRFTEREIQLDSQF
jgi:hypothetical protein